MELERFHLPESMREMRHAAASCLDRLDDDALSAHCRSASPRTAMHAIANRLEQGSAWIVRAVGRDAEVHASAADGHHNISAWPLWLRSECQRREKPLLYLMRSESVAGLRAALAETTSQGIFCNDAEAFSSRWPKSVQPALPLWLSAMADGTPYDPASGAETLAILRAALHALYIDGEPGFVYFSAHADGGDARALSAADGLHAFKGMYCAAPLQETSTASVRLLGAGKTLSQVERAAKLLQQDWGVASEIWSCPSYTRLARDAYAAERWNTLHPRAEKRGSHLQTCLGGSASPVLAVTGYAQNIASQIGGFVPARFAALGADSHPLRAGTDSTQWIAALALKALGEEGRIPLGRAKEALERYRLA
ncbi:transketolase-like TK C-terminal-containing protein [Pseudoduganella violacea]|uniref:Pyruvate dehydrogenase E1 component n=1 Tax=Pseudoduganella violacea TaxID=1715466 RepID=A0A7W5B5Z2_9BURK|nr:pyruvate dehydrogenase [Pseudoduganella violacea]MBB3117174.1 pyruvate dehydrogenase E1 component [Pseudoduganella violacea]